MTPWRRARVANRRSSASGPAEPAVAPRRPTPGGPRAPVPRPPRPAPLRDLPLVGRALRVLQDAPPASRGDLWFGPEGSRYGSPESDPRNQSTGELESRRGRTGVTPVEALTSTGACTPGGMAFLRSSTPNAAVPSPTQLSSRSCCTRIAHSAPSLPTARQCIAFLEPTSLSTSRMTGIENCAIPIAKPRSARSRAGTSRRVARNKRFQIPGAVANRLLMLGVPSARWTVSVSGLSSVHTVVPSRGRGPPKSTTLGSSQGRSAAADPPASRRFARSPPA